MLIIYIFFVQNELETIELIISTIQNYIHRAIAEDRV